MSVIAQVQGSYFHHLNANESLSQANNAYVFHDSRGFVWISSIDGLNRFDGLSVRIYRPNASRPRSMYGQNVISPFFEDGNGDLWFCTWEAVNCYRRRTDDFDHWQVANPSTRDTIREGYYAFYLDAKGQFWLRVGDGQAGQLFIFDTHTGKYEKRFPLIGNRCVVSGTSEGMPKTIFAFEYGIKNTFSQTAVSSNGRFNCKPQAPMPAIFDIWVEHDSLIWIASASGLMAFNPVSCRHSIYAVRGAKTTTIYAVKSLDKEKLAISTDGSGLQLFNRKNRSWVQGWHHRLDRASSLSNDATNDLYLDADRNFWVSDWEFGLNFFHLDKPKIIQLLLSDLNVPVRPATNSIHSLAEDREGHVWCATENGGLYVFDRKRRVRQIFQKAGWPVSSVLHLCVDRNGTLWLVTPKGIYWRDEKCNQLRRVIGSEKANLRLGGFLGESNTGRMCFSGVGFHEICQTPNRRAYFLRTKVLDPDLINAFIPFFFQARDGTFFINVNTAETMMLRPGEKPEKLPFNNLKACYEDPTSGDIWLATTYGLAKMNKKTKKCKLFDEASGLPNQYLYAVLPDSNGFLWLSSNKGILRFDSKAGTARSLGVADGVWENEFYTNAWLRTASGEIWMGNRDALNIFTPEKMREVSTLPKIQITELKVNDAPWESDTYIGETAALEFAYTDNTLSFGFVALEYSDPSNNRLRYRLQAYDNTWLDSRPGTPGFARYANLPPGHYVFQIRGANSDGIWSPALRELSIVIKPPFWQEWWFILLVAGMVIALVYALYRYRIHQLRTEFALRQQAQENEITAKENALKAAESEMTALRAQMNPHFIFNSLNSINAFILRNEGKTASAYLTDFARLIRQILDNSARETITLEGEIEFLESYLKTESLRLNNKLTYEIHVDENIDAFDTEIPSMVLQPYVENALWHGISPKSGSGHLSIEFKKEADGTLLMIVEDNGIGREKARALKAQRLGVNHQSKGLKITQERLALYDQKRGGQSTITAIDKKDETGAATGTRVEVRIRPVKI